MSIAEFLKAILPQGGWYFCMVLVGRTTKHYEASTPEALSALCLAQDQAQHNTYFALGAYKAPFCLEVQKGTGRQKKVWRKSYNCESIRCIALDLDCGDATNKPYKTQADAIASLDQFLATTNFPPPRFVVNSGNGVHCYWVFPQSITKLDNWQRAAEVFFAVASHFDLHGDPTVTADRTQVLRPIETSNWKDPTNPKPVSILREGSELPFADFNRELARIIGAFQVPIKRKKPRSSDNSLKELQGASTPSAPSDAEKIAAKCAVLKEMKETKGANQAEPLWYACLGVLLYTTQGRAIAHKWSSGHSGYSADETDYKLDRREETGFPPTTCSAISQESPLCASCSYSKSNIGSPLTLGRDDSASKPTTTPITRKDWPDFPEAVKREKFEFDGKTLRWKKQVTDKVTKTSVEKVFRVTEQLTWPMFIWYDEDEEQYMLHIKVRAWQNKFSEADIRFSVLGDGSRGLTRELAAKAGVVCMEEEGMSRFMRTWANDMRSAIDITCVSTKQGWREDNSFQLGASRFTPKGQRVETVISKRLATYVKPMQPRGSLNRFVEIIDHLYNHPGLERYQIFWLASLASPLLRLADSANCGIAMSAHSAATGIGKSAVCRAGLGVWGDPSAYGQAIAAKNATPHGFFTMAGIRHNLPLLFDEATDLDPREVSNFLYTFSEGLAKVQGAKDGGLRNNSDLNWNTICYVTSNRSIVDILASQIRNAAPQAARVLEVEFPPIKFDLQDSRLLTELTRNSGTVGPYFIKNIVTRQEKVATAIHKELDALATATQVTTHARYWLRLSASILVACALGAALRIHRFPINPIRDLLIELICTQAATAEELVEDPLDLVADLLSDLYSGMIITYNSGDLRKNIPAIMPDQLHLPRSSLTGRAVLDEGFVHVSASAVREWCGEKGVGFRSFKSSLYKMGVLVATDERVVLTRGLSIPSERARCWKLNLTHSLRRGLVAAQDDNVSNIATAREKRQEQHNEQERQESSGL